MSYEVRPEDVVVVDVTRGGGAPPTPEGKVAGWLRRYRLRIAVGIAVIEMAALVFGDVRTIALILVGVLFVGFHIRWGRQLRSATLRQVSWILAFAQGLAALVPVFIGTVAIAFVAVLAVALLIGLMVLLGDRGR